MKRVHANGSINSPTTFSARPTAQEGDECTSVRSSSLLLTSDDAIHDQRSVTAMTMTPNSKHTTRPSHTLVDTLSVLHRAWRCDATESTTCKATRTLPQDAQRIIAAYTFRVPARRCWVLAGFVADILGGRTRVHVAEGVARTRGREPVTKTDG